MMNDRTAVMDMALSALLHDNGYLTALGGRAPAASAVNRDLRQGLDYHDNGWYQGTNLLGTGDEEDSEPQWLGATHMPSPGNPDELRRAALAAMMQQQQAGPQARPMARY